MSIKVTADNYHSLEVNQAYFSSSQIKMSRICPASWRAYISGEWVPEDRDAFFLGQYVDVALTGSDREFRQFCKDNQHRIMRQYPKGAKFQNIEDLDTAIDRMRNEPLCMEYLTGEHQIIITVDFHGHPVRVKPDVLNFELARLVDLKTCRGVDRMEYDPVTNTKKHWIKHWGYEFQAALYREAIFLKYGFLPEPYIVATEKRKPYGRGVFHLEATPLRWREVQDELCSTMDMMEDLRSMPLEEAERCESHDCEYCMATLVLHEPIPIAI